jgi:NTE family protein
MRKSYPVAISLILVHLIFILPGSFAQEKGKRPKIGLTLSGGGAKGLAHIGILKAIDSAGLKVDYITGTSMGSIVGGLYAVGYSGNAIEKLAEQIDWSVLLTNESSLQGIIMEEKSEYKRYAVELPYEKGFKLPTGVVESEELWLTLSELFFPVYNIKDFSGFSIPFRCIATDAASGEGVTLGRGEIVSALRASMAIPSFFTSVDIDGQRLVDGGVVRNFPVSDVRKIGADIVIGVNVAAGLNSKEKLNNPISVLSNIIFFKEAENTRTQIRQCDIYVPIPLNDFSTASFGKSREIMDSGILIGRSLYPRFKAIADSLERTYGPEPFRENRIPPVDSVKITDYQVTGLAHTDEKFFLDMMGFRKNRFYTSEEISRRIRKGFGTRYYSRITYKLEAGSPGEARIIFQVKENPRSSAKLSLHYNSFSGISLVMNLTSRNLFSKSSRTLASFNLGENMRLRLEHMEYLGKHRNFSLTGGINLEYLDFPQYVYFEEFAKIRQKYFKVFSELAYSFNRSNMVGIGLRHERIRYDPSLIAIFDIKGKNNLTTTSVFFQRNTLNRNIYPSKGLRLHFAADWVMTQSGELTFYREGTPIFNSDTADIAYDPYTRLNLLVEGFWKIGKKGVLLASLQSGVNFNYNQYFTNDYIVGGLTRQFRNQVVFAGYQENMLQTNSASALQLGYQHEILEKLHLTWRSNGMLYDFVNRKSIPSNPDFLSGHALTVGYLTTIGPVEFSVMYGDQSRKLGTYVNIGLQF